jgi:rare lipoprotein A
MKWLPLAVAALLVLVGCAHKPVTVAVPAVPETEEKPTLAKPVESGPPRVTVPAETDGVVVSTKPVLVETGIASWYGAPYHNRRSSNGEVYDMRALTAAHRTLPLGSIVRVINPETENSVVVRITDRGPFIKGRVIDLSHAAAAQIGIIAKGTAPVRLEVLKTPVPIDAGGRWAVQIGGFGNERAARDLAGHLSHRYHTAQVRTFDSPVGDWWIRVRVKDDLRARAEELMRETSLSQADMFLVRLD